jgi:hypothetical protein
MTIELNRTIVPVRDKDKSSRSFADISGSSMRAHRGISLL